MSKKVIVHIDPELEDLIPGFLENRRKDVIKIGDATAKSDLAEIKNIGHKLKGNAGGYGFDQLSVIGAELEKAANNSDIPLINNLTQEIVYYLNSIEIVYDKK